MKAERRWGAPGCVLALLMLLSLSPAPRAEEAPPLPVYIVGTEALDYYPHYAFTVRNSFAEELLSAFARTYGIRFEYSVQPVQRLYEGLMSGQTIDFKYPDSPEWGQELKQDGTVYYSAPVSAFVEGIYVLPEHRGQGLERIRRLGIVQGFSPNVLRDRLADGHIELVQESDLGKLLLMCLRGQIDGVYANRDLRHHWVTEPDSRIPGLVFDDSLPWVRGRFYLSTTRHPEVIEAFDRFLQEHADRVAQLRQRFGIPHAPEVIEP